MHSVSPLTPRQQEIMHLTSKGMCRKEIAQALGISLGAVINHRYYVRKIVGDEHYRRMVYRNAE